MQKADDGSHPGPTEAGASEAPRVLERANDIEIQRDGRSIAKLVHLEEIGEVQETQGVVWRRLRARELRWSSRTALFLLMGTESFVLYPPYLLLRGKPRPEYSTRPGMDDVQLVEVISHPEGMTPLDLFSVVGK